MASGVTVRSAEGTTSLVSCISQRPSASLRWQPCQVVMRLPSAVRTWPPLGSYVRLGDISSSTSKKGSFFSFSGGAGSLSSTFPITTVAPRVSGMPAAIIASITASMDERSAAVIAVAVGGVATASPAKAGAAARAIRHGAMRKQRMDNSRGNAG